MLSFVIPQKYYTLTDNQGRWFPQSCAQHCEYVLWILNSRIRLAIAGADIGIFLASLLGCIWVSHSRVLGYWVCGWFDSTLGGDGVVFEASRAGQGIFGGGGAIVGLGVCGLDWAGG